MLASWNWLTDYLAIKAPVAEVADRLTMAGVTVESIDETPEDFILDVEITSNRPDWLSHIGIAREIAALYHLPLRLPTFKLAEAPTPVEDHSALEVPDADLCPFYTGRVIRGVKVAPSPSWLVEKIESVGLRSVNNIVDITNFVMHECGQPLHAFDLARLAGGKVIVRRAVSGEHINMIDGAKHTLTDSDLVIADHKHPVAIAGIMGGIESEIGPDTTDVFLESALFDQYSVRMSAKRLAISTDASYRFERGVDIETVDWASRRAAALILQLAGGTLSKGVLAVGTSQRRHAMVTLRNSHLTRILGIGIPIEETRAVLSSLGFILRGGSPDETLVEVPSFRADVKQEIDLVEEVGRIAGYDRIPFQTHATITVGEKTARERLAESAESVLTAAGFFGCLSYSLVSGETFKAFTPWTEEPPLYIENRLGHENVFLRTSLVPSLLQARKTNQDRRVTSPDLYEIAHIYLPSADEVPHQPLMIAAATGESFAALKGILERVGAAVGAHGEASLGLRPADLDFMAPGQSASILLGGEKIGYAGHLADGFQQAFGLDDPVFVAELDTDRFAVKEHMAPAFKPLYRFPGVERDLAFIVDDSVNWADITACIESANAENLDAVSFESVYRGAPIPDGRKSVALHVTFRSGDRTLTGREADLAQEAIVGALAAAFGASLR